MRDFYISWWCEKWNRPSKDPILQSYTLEELIYEYHSVNEKRIFVEELREEESDKIEEAKAQKDDDWADRMEAEEEERLKQEAEAAQKKADEEWMQKHMDEQKELNGEDYGEDLSTNFEKE